VWGVARRAGAASGRSLGGDRPVERVTEAVYQGESPKGFPADLVKVVRRKLGYLDAAVDLNDLRSPPGNRLEALSRDRDGQHSIRVNDQFRVCFIWTEEGPKDVEITDCH
jgi:proteic killer suppression protein